MALAEAVSIKRRILSAIVAIVLIFSSLSLVSCNYGDDEVLSKEEITERASREKQGSYGYALDYFEDWGIPIAERYEQKVLTVQYIYLRNYYKSEVKSNAFY